MPELTFSKSPIGFIIPFIINTANDISNKGVRTFPIISITLLGFIVSTKTIKKNITENKYGFIFPKSGEILTSNVVAAVLGTTNIGPKHNIIKISKVIPNFLPALPTTPWKDPALETATIDKNIIPTSDIINPKKLINHSLPDVNPMYGGNIRFPAPKNIENKANPITSISFFLFIFYNPNLINLYFSYKKAT